ncbi:MAG: hypothetical protein JJU29_18090 [Verrucomicrobia bacterium]|nr:hypothetical protein [Verrucomicrobiota bacterium]MCH8513240.1 DUF5682 family protein [Kiritimatiellia bacterium]
MSFSDFPCPPEWERELADFLDVLAGPDLVFAPIRHHSPACAWHLARLIRDLRPSSVLIEGPQSMDALIPFLVDPALVPPVAVYLGGTPTTGEGSYFPLCAYSPEFVALREGHALGARLRFIDLEPGPAMPHRLCDDHHFLHSQYLRALAKREGCRDSHEFWDRHFESAFRQEDSPAFWRRIAAYCFLARLTTSAESLTSDGTLAREARMLELLRAERKRKTRRKETGPILVVTGGFHTPALAGNRMPRVESPPTSAEAERLLALIPYSFRELDTLNGYAAGMPQPGYYQRLWDHPGGSPEGILQDVAMEVLTDLARSSREAAFPQPLSTADLAAAHQQACLLARFRGNPGPLREDLLDGVRSSFVKGSLDADGNRILALAWEMLCGEQLGQVPAGVPLHPLVAEFRARCQTLGLRIDSATRRKLDLDIHRNARHREISRFLRLLDMLDVSFARFCGGPDFVRGTGLDLLIEHWEYAWSPQLESRFLHLGTAGATFEEVLTHRLNTRAAELQSHASGGCVEAVALLLVCARLGFPERAAGFVPLVETILRREDDFSETADALRHLDLLLNVPSPLETGKLEGLHSLLQSAYLRACLLIGDFPNLSPERAEAALKQMHLLLSALASDSEGTLLEPRLFWEACENVVRNPSHGLDPLLWGGLLGLLWRQDARVGEDVMQLLRVQDPGRGAFTRFLRGLLHTRRELAWLDEPLMCALIDIIQDWDAATFARSLPELRLAFSDLTPSETDRAARLLARLHDAPQFTNWYAPTVNEALVQRCIHFAARLETVLAQDGLSHFLPDESH